MMSPLRGVVVSPSIFLRQQFGGISRVFAEVVRELDQRRVDVRVPAPLYCADALRNADVRGQGAHVPRLFERSWSRRAAKLAAELASLDTARRLRSQAGYVWHETYLGRRRTSLPYVVSAYDLIYETYGDQLPNAQEVLASKARSYREADGIVAISHDTARKLHEHYGVDRDLIDVAHLGTDHGTFRPLGPATDTNMLLFVGNRGAYKEFETLLHALSESGLKDRVRLRCFGGGAPSASELALIGTLGLEGIVDFDSGSDRRLADAYRDALALVYPSLEEGFGLPLLEAMACGCPVLASDGGALPEVSDGAALHFEAGAKDALCAAITQLVGDAALRAELRARGIVRARDFTWARATDQLLSAYKRSLERR